MSEIDQKQHFSTVNKFNDKTIASDRHAVRNTILGTLAGRRIERQFSYANESRLQRGTGFLFGTEAWYLRMVFLFFLLACPNGISQVASARLEGTIRDPSGYIVPGSRVSVVNTRTQMQAVTSTTTEGRFVFLSLQPGSYTISVEAAGFPKKTISNLELNVGATVAQDIVLEIGDVKDQINVEADGERVQATDAQVTRAVTLRDIEALPQLGRDSIGLGIFTAGVQITTKDPSRSHVNGTREESTDIRLDGIEIADNSYPRLLWTTVAHNEDSVEEYRIVTSGGKAEYGRNAGGLIQMITRSGTNAWHGGVFEYHRNTIFDANTFFGNSSGLQRPVFIQNTFGASLDGPIQHERTFIFGNYQGRRNSQQIVRNRLVLTPEAKAGLFRWRPPGSSDIQTFNILSHDPRGLGIDPEIAEILELLPDPNNSDIGDGLNTAGFRFNNPSIASIDDISHDQFTIRLDHTLWSSHHIFFRWSWNRSSFIDTPGNSDARFPGQPHGTQDYLKWGYSIGSDWAITPCLFNELRVGYSSSTNDVYRPARLEGPMLLSNSWTDPLNPAFPQKSEPSLSQITDSFTVVKGEHILKGGIEARFTQELRSNDAGIWPNVSFGTTYGNAPPAAIGPFDAAIISSADRQSFEKLYNDLLGRMNLVIQTFNSDLSTFLPAGTPRLRIYRYHEFSWFFQDDWKIHPRLVLNLGMRYEFFGVPSEINGYEGIVDKAALINSAAQYSDITIQRGGPVYNGDFNNFAPRIGLAWDPTGSSKMAIRANWGIFYDRPPGRTMNSVGANTPGFSQLVPIFPNSEYTDIRVSDGIPLPQPPVVPELRLPSTRSANLTLFDPKFRTGYVQQYSLAIEREILRNTVIEARYVGSHGIKLFMGLNLNQSRIYEDFLSAFRELQDFLMDGTPVPASNTLVRIFGSAGKAVSAIGAGTLEAGAVGTAADSVDRLSYKRYAGAGVSDFYLRNFPQFNSVTYINNDGRSFYNSFQLSLRRYAGALKFVGNYTFSKSMDNASVSFYMSPIIDNFDLRSNRARSDYDIPHVFTLSMAYTLPIGKDRRFAAKTPRWVDLIIGNWDIGLLALWQSGSIYTCSAGRATGPTTNSSFCNYAGDHNVGGVRRKEDGVYWFSAEEISRFSFPAAGEIGTSGRNGFRGPRFFNVDLSLKKKFRIREQQAFSFAAEAYNLFNNVNFDVPNADLSNPAAFGKISSAVGNPRILQMALRYSF